MLNEAGYSALGPLYDTAVNPGRWRRALDAVGQAVDAKAIALLIRRPEPTAKDLQMLNSTYLKFTKSPWGLYYGLRLSHFQQPDWAFLARQPTHQPTLDTEMAISVDDLDRRADYAFLRKKLGIGRRVGVRLNSDMLWFDAISLSFAEGLQTAPAQAMTDLLPLLPHITKTVEMGRMFAQLKARYSAVLTALDHVRTGLAVALPSGDLVVENAELRRILSLKDGLSKGPDGRLRCTDPDQTSEIAAAIAQAGQTARGEEAASERLMLVRRASGAAPFLVDVVPLKDSQAQLDGPLEGALVTVIDPDRVPHLNLHRFAALYDLTPAETDVFGHVLQGVGIDGIADLRSTSPVTAKNQVAAILAKTGVHRRSELIRLVLRVMPPVD